MDGCSRFDASRSTPRPDSRSTGCRCPIRSRPGQPAGRARKRRSPAVRGVAATTAATTGGAPGGSRGGQHGGRLREGRAAGHDVVDEDQERARRGSGRCRGSRTNVPARLARRCAGGQRRGVPHPPAAAQQPGLRRRAARRPAVRRPPDRVSSRTWSRPRVRSAARELGTGTSSSGPLRSGTARLTAATASASAVPSGRASSARPRSLKASTAGPHRPPVGAGGDGRRKAPRDPPRRGRAGAGQQGGAPAAQHRPGHGAAGAGARQHQVGQRGDHRPAHAAQPVPAERAGATGRGHLWTRRRPQSG